MASVRTRKQLLEAAEKLFLHQGPEETSMREITQAAGVGLATVNYHFGSKENLLAEVAANMTADLVAEQERALRSLDEARAKPTMAAIVRAFLAPYSAMMDRPDGRDRLRFVMQIIGGPPSRAREELEASYTPLEDMLLRLLGRAKPRLSSDDTRFRLRCMIAVVLFYLNGGFAAETATSPVPGARVEGDDFIIEQLSALLEAPSARPAPGRRPVAA